MQSEKRLGANNHNEMIEAPPSSVICLVSEWLANLDNQQTRRAYRSDIQDFFVLVGARSVEDLLEISRGHVLMWRAALEKAGLSAATRRRKLAALACLFDYLIERDPRYTRNPVCGFHAIRTLSPR